jgi:CBS domain-containing protein
MLVSDILKYKGREVVTISPEDTLEAVVDLLTERRIGAAVVVDGSDIVGIVSERDIMRAAAEHGTGALACKARDAMTREVSSCGEGDRIEEIMAHMTEGRFRHMPVLRDRQLVGIVSIGDVVKARLEELEREAEAMREYIADSQRVHH